jgi:ribosome-binding factor A
MVIKERKHDKLSSLIKEMAAEFLLRESNKQTLITVTDVSLSRDGKYATIFFTVYPEEKEKEVLSFTKRKIADFLKFLSEKKALIRFPFFDFKIDQGEKHRQKIDKISDNYS